MDAPRLFTVLLTLSVGSALAAGTVVPRVKAQAAPRADTGASSDTDLLQAVERSLTGGDIPAAIRNAYRLRTRDTQTQAFARIARVENRKHHPADAVRWLRKAEALQTLTRDDTDCDALAAVSEAEADLHDFPAAKRTLHRIPLDMHHPGPSYVSVVEALTTLADAETGAGKRDDARRSLREAARLAPNIGRIFAEMGDGPTGWTANAYLAMAPVATKLGDRQQAKRLLDRAEGAVASTQNQTALAATMHGIAGARRQIGDAAGAKRCEYAARLADHMGSDAPTAENRRYALLTMQAEDGDIRGALRAARAEPDPSERIYALCSIADVQAKRGDRTGAHATYAETRALLPRIPALNSRQQTQQILDRREAAIPR